jgi:hypothetical protein
MAWQELDPKIFGTRQPFSGQLSQIALIGDNQNAVVTVFITNTSGANPAIIRLAIKPQAETTDPKHFLLYNTTISPKETVLMPNICLGPNSEVYGYSNTGSVTFNITGEKIINNP